MLQLMRLVTLNLPAKTRAALSCLARMPAGEDATNWPEMTENPLRATRCGGTRTASPIFYPRL